MLVMISSCVPRSEKTGQVFFSFYTRFSMSLSRKKQIPWCITTGVKWLFGMYRSTNNGYQSFYVNEPIVLDEELKDDQSLETILKVLSVWVRT